MSGRRQTLFVAGHQFSPPKYATWPGPYMLDSQDAQQIVLTRHDKHWGQTIALALRLFTAVRLR